MARGDGGGRAPATGHAHPRRGHGHRDGGQSAGRARRRRDRAGPVRGDAGRGALPARADPAGGHITFVTGEAEHLPFEDASFDALTFTYLLRYVDDPAATLMELARVVKPGGRIGMVEFGVPDNPTLRQLWRAHTRVGLPVMGRAVSTAWYEVGRFLGPNIEQFHAAYPDLGALWERAGIDGVIQRRMSFGAGLVMWGVRDGHHT